MDRTPSESRVAARALEEHVTTPIALSRRTIQLMRTSWVLVLFCCTPEQPSVHNAPTFEPTAPSNAPRWLSDIEIHADTSSWSFVDHEDPPQRITHEHKEVLVVGVNASGLVVGADRVIAALRPQFRGCYNAGLRRDPDQQGQVVYSVKVGPSGGTPTVDLIRQSGLDDGVTACIKSKLEMGAFDRPDGGASTIQVPITFVQQGKQPSTARNRTAAATMDFIPLVQCLSSRDAGATLPTSATFTVFDGDGGFDVRVDSIEGDRDVLGCAATVLTHIEKGAAPRPFALRISFLH